MPAVQAPRPFFEVKARNNGGVSRYTSWALVQHGGRGSRPQNRGIPTFPTTAFLAKSPKKASNRLPIDINRRSSRRGQLRRNVGSARLIASSTDHATIIKSVFPAPTNGENVIRLGRVWTPCVFVVEKAMAERTMSNSLILTLGQDSLPPMEVLRGTRPRHPCPLPSLVGRLGFDSVAYEPARTRAGKVASPPGVYVETPTQNDPPPIYMEGPPEGMRKGRLVFSRDGPSYSCNATISN